MARSPKILKAVLVLVALLVVPHAQGAPKPPAAATQLVYLPMVQQPDPFGAAPAIWSHAGPPAAHEVALFRHTFTLASPAAGAALEIFADTRYELWLDGTWRGRGPARFSYQSHEYDRYALGTLGAGAHTIAVLVQWAPNVRRSESTAPALQARMVGSAGLATSTSTGWRALASPAWRSDAALVHAWGLIGPTELLDLRALPANWMQPGFDDGGWPAAAAAAAPPGRVAPGTLPTLANVPIPAAVRESGVLAPGMRIAELLGDSTRPVNYTLRALASTTITIETLASAVSGSRTLTLDGSALEWQPRPNRPDVVFATRALGAGKHTLTASSINAPGLTIGVSTENLDTSALPFSQSTHAGRRMLLAAPASQAGAVSVTPGAALTLNFQQTPSYAVIDVGRTVYGRVSATVSGPAGTVLDMGWDERLWQNARPLPFPGSLHPEWNQTDSWVLDGTARAISTIDARGGRYLLLAVWGAGPVQLSNLRVLEERLPVEQRGSFSSGDARLNQIWQVGVDTLRPNMSDAYSDPWREHGQWWGDAFVIDHANEAALGDSFLLARGLRQIAEAFENGRPVALAPHGTSNHMLDYGMLWAQSLHDYLRRTGDTRRPAQLYPTLVSFMGYLEQYANPSTTLLDIPYGTWQETTLIDWAAFADRYGQSTAVNSMFYRTLLDAADLASAAGDPARAAGWQARAAQIKAAINANLYMPAQGAYSATLWNGTLRVATPHAQAFALAYSVVPAAEQQRVANSLVASLASNPANPNLEVYGMFWVLEGLGRAGRIADANTIIKRYYGFMLDHGATTWWENFNAYQSYTASLSHGWGSSPTWFLTRWMLGAERTGPQTWAFAPPMRSVAGAAGALPLATGALQASWATPSCGQNTADIAAPAGSSGTVLVPFNDSATVIALNGTTIWQNGQALGGQASAVAGGVEVRLGSGQFHLGIQHSCG
jgi:alpha-L-rhamnosidase